MIFDVNLELSGVGESFLDDLEELIEEYMVHFFLLNAKDEGELARAKTLAAQEQHFYYCAPYGFSDDDKKCVGVYLSQRLSVEALGAIEKPLVIDGAVVDAEMLSALDSSGKRGIILDAPLGYAVPEGFFLGVSSRSLAQNSSDSIEKLTMDRIVLHSNYPDSGYDDLYGAVKTISDTLLRPEQSIIAQATKNALCCFGLR